LHVLGHDHEFPEEARFMRREERRLARMIGLPWPYQVGEERSRRRTPGRD
jgi:ssRNA-specific RNase YbeY (16S rRNA maturation enzyme)